MLNRLIDIREEANLTQSEMAKILKVSQSNYSRWETSKEFIPLEKLNELCNYFNVSMDYTLGISKQNKVYDKIKLDKKLIGNNLKKFRKENNITQLQLAKVLNTSHSTISAYEHGKTLMLTAFLLEINNTYKVSIDFLVGKNKEAK